MTIKELTPTEMLGFFVGYDGWYPRGIKVNLQ